MLHLCTASRTWPDWDNKRMKKRQTCTTSQPASQKCWGLWWGKYSTLQAWSTYFIQLNKEARIWLTTKHGRLANLYSNSLHYGSSFQAVKYQREEIKPWWTFSAHTTSILMNQAKALPLFWASPTRGDIRLCHFPMDLDMAMGRQDLAHVHSRLCHSGVHCSSQCRLVSRSCSCI